MISGIPGNELFVLISIGNFRYDTSAKTIKAYLAYLAYLATELLKCSILYRTNIYSTIVLLMVSVMSDHKYTMQ